MKNDWIRIKNYYTTRNISLEEIAKKFKVSISAVRKHASQEKWSELKKKKCIEIEQKVDEKITEKEIDKKVKANQLHNELYTKSLEVANRILDSYLEELSSKKKKKRLANAYNLDFITKAIANAQKGQRLALNIENDNIENIEPKVSFIKGFNLEDI